MRDKKSPIAVATIGLTSSGGVGATHGGPTEPTLMDLTVQRLLEEKADLAARVLDQNKFMSAQSSLLKLHQDKADRCREKVNQLEQLLGMIPRSEGDFFKAKSWLAQLVNTGFAMAPARVPRDAERDQVEFKAEAAAGTKESLCVGEVTVGDGGRGAWLRCLNCNVVVARMTHVQFTVHNFKDTQEMTDFWQADWAKHLEWAGGKS